MTGSEWLSGQAFCNLHFTLAISEGIKSMLVTFQSDIGADQLFPKTVIFQMNIEDNIVIIQILDCWMRLTSSRCQARTWNKYKSFSDYAECMRYQNVGHMLHANHFGEFEEKCPGWVYLVDVWMVWLDTFSDVQNQLICFLHTVSNLMEMCKMLWADPALVGIHVIVPFMTMLLDHKVTHQMLTILPNLYNDQCRYPQQWPVYVFVLCHLCSHIFYIYWKDIYYLMECLYVRTEGVGWGIWSILNR